MSFEEFDDRFIWKCDNCSLTVEFAPHSFHSCWSELRARGWRAKREQAEDGVDWSHSCGRCVKRADTGILDRKPRLWKQT
jgi:hypothetical protein